MGVLQVIGEYLLIIAGAALAIWLLVKIATKAPALLLVLAVVGLIVAAKV